MEPPIEPTPPDDPDEWSDDEWLAWLNATDTDAGDASGANVARRPRSAGSSMLYAAMFGLHQAIYGAVEEIAIIEEAPGEPDEPQSLEVHLEPEQPNESTVVLRPWLMDAGERDD